MATAAPYWGNLPGPNLSTRSRQPSSSSDYSSRPPGLQSSDTAAALAPQTRFNRVSTQTNVTESQTESSLSPYASPRESLQGHGLAPRPISQTNYSSGILEKRRRRASKNREEEDVYPASGALPAAPEAPQGPPPSFRHPYGNGGLPYTLPKTGDLNQPDIPPSPGAMDAAAYHPVAVDRTHRSSTISNRRSSSGSTAPARNGSAPGYRKSSLGNELDDRLFAKTRSPLQTLELTLDSITKEEKRKRVEAAERDARERVSRSPRQNGTQTPIVRFKDKNDESDPDTPRTRARVEPVSTQIGGMQKRVRLEAPQQKFQHEASQSRSQSQSRSRTDPNNKVAFIDATQETSTPQRNLSFRDRAARDDIKLPKGGADLTPIATPPLTTPTGSISLTRNGSNKLKKEPPGDPWYSRRAEAEKKFGQITTRRQRGPSQDPVEAEDSSTAANPAAADPDRSTLGGGSMRNKVPPLDTAVARRKPGRIVAADDGDDDDDLDSPIPPGSSSNVTNTAKQRQVPASTKTFSHSRFPSVSDYPQNGTPKGKATTGVVDGAAAVAGAAVLGAHSQHDENNGDDADREHYFSEMFHRHEYKPGKGLYKSPKYLSDWKKGTVGTLSGTMLDLADDLTPKAVKTSSTWWETPPSLRGGSNSRPQRAEAFDGEYDETNGTQISSDIDDDDGKDGKESQQCLRQSQTVYCDEGVPRSFESSGHKLSSRKREARHQTRLCPVGRSLAPLRVDQGATCLSTLCSSLSCFSPLDPPRQHLEHTLLTHAARMVIRVPNSIGPTRFKPPLYLKCGPLLRYCGMRNERLPSRSTRNGPSVEREFWRGSVMIVTADDESSYDIAPTLRIFAQPLEVLPPPPAEVRGELPPEYIDPVAGHPKLGRRGETRYVRPVDHLEEGKDSSRGTSDGDLFERTRSPPEVGLPEGPIDATGSFMDRKRKSPRDGEKLSKYKDIRGYRLHAERGYTFWRFSIEVELREKEQRIAYRINRGPATGFWVPAKGQSMNIMFHSCNGFSMSVNPDELSGPDPLWRDVLNNHQSRPFHVMIGGGDQLYCDAVMRQTKHFQDWLMIRNPLHKHDAPFTVEMQDELETFYLERYCMWFAQGLFGLANSQIPMVNMYDDHDIIDGFGSYPDHFMRSPVFSGLGNVAFKYYMLFQQQSIIEETEETEPSWVLGLRPGPYINELSRSLFLQLGSKIALLAVDCRTERMRDQVVRDDTWDKLMDRCYSEIIKGKTEHLLVLLGVPIAYPRLVWLENILTSRLLDPIKALGKTGLFGNVFNKFDGGVEVLDDLDDHWTAKNHKAERKTVIEDLQDLAADRSVRVTILSGDVHLAAIGQFYSNPKLELAKHKDFRYMANVISSAIVNTPPPDLMADVLNKRNKVHHLDKDTDEDMIPMFAHGVEGKPRNNKRLLPHRNWCSIREYTPGETPPSTPPDSSYEEDTPVGSPGTRNGGLLRKGVKRRLSKRDRGPSYRADVIDSRPPISAKAPGSLFRTLSSRGRRSDSDVEAGMKRPSTGKRTLSLTRGDFAFLRRGSKARKPDDGGINGTWGDEDAEYSDYEHDNEHERGGGGFLGAIGLRGGGGDEQDEFSEGDDSYFTTRAPANVAATPRAAPGSSASKTARLLGEEAPPATNSRGLPSPTPRGGHSYGATTVVSSGQQQQLDNFRPQAFHRTPTGASAKQLKRTRTWDVNIQGGLDITLNVEVSAKDPAGITAPYRLLVPKLWYDAAEGDAVELPAKGEGGVRRLLSLSRGGSKSANPRDASSVESIGATGEWQRMNQQDRRTEVSGASGSGIRGGQEHAPGTAI